MNRSTFYSLDDEFKFGKHQGSSLRNIIELDPAYLVWCLVNLRYFLMSRDLIEDIRDKYPDFPGIGLLGQHELSESDFNDEDEDYYHGHDDYYEERHFEEYAGTYAQDVMGWSDEMIDDALDGDPDAYWNID